MKTTSEYFKLSVDELVDTWGSEYTNEESLLFDEGKQIIFFNNIRDMESKREELLEYNEKHNFDIKLILKTVNERIAIVLIQI